MIWPALEAIGTILAAIISAIAIYLTVQLSRKQILLEQRQLLLPLYDRVHLLNDINPDNPVWPDVIEAANVLELLAICWEGQLIDEGLIQIMYSDLYIHFYEKIELCKNPPQNVARNGRGMLQASPSTVNLYNLLLRERNKSRTLEPIT